METHSQIAASVLVLLSALFSLSSGLPVRYDQRQEGEFNVHAHLENFIIVLIPSSSISLADFIQFKKNNPQQQGTKHLSAAVGGNNSGKYVPPSTGIKSSSPDFPAGKSPYKVDLDILKPEAETSKIHKELEDEKTSAAAAEEVVIAHPPPVQQSKTPAKTEPESSELSATLTTALSNDVTSTENSSEIEKSEDSKDSTDKVANIVDKKDESSNQDETTEENKEDADSKKDIVAENENKEESDKPTDNKEEANMEKEDNGEVKEKIDVEKKVENNEDKTTANDEKKKEEVDKEDDIPTIEFIPEKSPKSPKSFDFVAPISGTRKQTEDDIPVIDFLPPFKAAKSSKLPSYRHEVSVSQKTDSSDELSHKLMLLKSGMSECGPDQRRDVQGRCQQIKRQRSGQYFPGDSRLPALQFGLSPAID